jgi:hypothetical protein
MTSSNQPVPTSRRPVIRRSIEAAQMKALGFHLRRLDVLQAFI